MIERARLNLAMQRLADGDRASFDTVFDGVEPVARRLAIVMLRAQPADVDDAVQNAMTKLFAQSHAFDPEGDVIRWAMTLTLWECRTLRKRRVRETRLSSIADEAIAANGPSPEDAATHADLLTSLHDVMGHVSEADATVLLKTSPATATERKRRQRATARLAALWRRYHGQH